MTLADANVLLDVFTDDATWFEWSAEQLKRASRGGIAINPVIYAELAPGFDNREDLEKALAFENLKRLPLPYEAGFRAGHAFLAYRRAGGERRFDAAASSMCR